jgi:ATP-dependent protease HslVU (ClpYQ) peptidase subunit
MGRRNYGGADPMDTIQLLLEDLGRQIGEAALKASEWKVRAIVAEATLAAIAGTEEDGPTLAAVPDAPEETEDAT